MFQKKQCVTTEPIWFNYEWIARDTPLQVRWGIRWAHFYRTNGQKLGKILKFAAKQKVVEI